MWVHSKYCMWKLLVIVIIFLDHRTIVRLFSAAISEIVLNCRARNLNNSTSFLTSTTISSLSSHDSKLKVSSRARFLCNICISYTFKARRYVTHTHSTTYVCLYMASVKVHTDTLIVCFFSLQTSRLAL